jgi:hypothetical protein
MPSTSPPSAFVRFQLLAPNVLRITHAPPGAHELPPDRPWLADILTGAAASPVAEGQGLLHGQVENACVAVYLQSQSAAPYFAEVRPPSFTSQRGVRLAFRLHPGEGFYGWGEWFNAFRRTTANLNLINSD